MAEEVQDIPRPFWCPDDALWQDVVMHAWDWHDAGDVGTEEQRREFFQHKLASHAAHRAPALQVAMEERPLDVPFVQEIHRIMFAGSAAAGELRGAPAQDVANLLHEQLAGVERAMQGETGIHLVRIVSGFLSDFLAIRPFAAGNDAVARVVAAYLLHRGGFPFPVALTSGYPNAREHYVAALQRSRGRGEKRFALLDAYVVASMDACWSNFVRFCNPIQGFE
eukprot:scaffold4110_cov117-Pinguiococcus_pyrenoidosus.AAC.1